MTAAHTIGSAVFEIKLDPALLPWPDLATDIGAQLLPVVETVFDATGGEFSLDTLQIDIGLTRFSGSWCGLRERLSRALQDALKGHRPLVAAAGTAPASQADLVQPGLEVSEDLALAAETVERGFAADERLQGRLQGADDPGSGPAAELGRLARPLGWMPLQRLVLEPHAGALPAAGLVERPDSSEMLAWIAALTRAAAEDGAKHPISAETERRPRHEPGPHPTPIARLTGVGLPEVTPPGLGPDFMASGLAEAATPSPWTAQANGISEATDVPTSIRQAVACGDTAAAAALVAKTAPAAGIDAEVLAAPASPGMPPSPGETVAPPSAAGSAAWRSTSASGSDPAGPDETTHDAGSQPAGGHPPEEQCSTSEGSEAAPGETVPPPLAGAPAARHGVSARGIDPAAAPRRADPSAAPDEAIPGGRGRSAGARGRGDRPTAADGHLAGPDHESAHAPSRHSAALPPAAIEASPRERLALMLAEGALAPAALAVLLDAPALAAVVDHLLAATEAAAPGADTATFRTAIDRHRAAARDQSAFLAGVAVALAQGIDLDLEAIAAATSVPHDDAPDTDASKTDALGPPAARPDLRAFFVFLKEGAAGPRARLIDAAESAMARSPAQFARLVRTALCSTPASTRHESVVSAHGTGGEDGRASAASADEKAILRLVGLLPERLLHRTAQLLRPETAPRLLKLFDLISNTLLTDGLACEGRAMMARCWIALFRHLLVYGEETDLRRFVANLTATMASYPAAVRGTVSVDMAADPWPTRAAKLCQVALALIELARNTTDTVADGITASSAVAIAQPDVVLVAEESAGIDNAGLVLAAPFMPRLFTLLDLLDQGIFKTPEAALHATRVLQYVVDGRAEVGRPPPPLNRILCGVDAAQSKIEARPLGALEIETVDGLVAMMLEHWRSIGNTSPAGLREAFLRRPGRLQRRQEEWHLRVEPRAYDMLLDRLPWSFSIIKHPWMKSPIHVAWR